MFRKFVYSRLKFIKKSFKYSRNYEAIVYDCVHFIDPKFSSNPVSLKKQHANKKKHQNLMRKLFYYLNWTK